MFLSVAYYETQEAWATHHVHGSHYVLFVAEHTAFSWQNLPAQTPCFGAIFPYVIFESNHYSTGIVAIELSEKTHVTLVESMSNGLQGEVSQEDTSLFVIVDGLSSHIVDFLEALFEESAAEATIIGGGCGKLTLKQEPVIFSNMGIFQDAALLIGANVPLTLGVGHGWKELVGPLMATKTKRNILQELNYKDAFSVYKEIVEADRGEKFTEDNFFDLAKSYPFGIKKYGSEMIVRDPIATDGASLILVGEMDQNAVVSILKGDDKALIVAAGKASSDAVTSFEGRPRMAIVIDCVSRVLFLEDKFSQELHAIESGVKDKVLQFGALTLGEIANNNSGNIEFYNKTCVIGMV